MLHKEDSLSWWLSGLNHMLWATVPAGPDWLTAHSNYGSTSGQGMHHQFKLGQ